MMNRSSCLFVGIVALSTATAWGDSWPQFRGPAGNGVSTVDSVPRQWTESEGVRWKTEIPGLGHSSPVHNGRIIWMTTASADGRALGAVSVDADSGRKLHEVTVFQPGDVEEIHHDNSYASPSPILDGSRLYVHFGTYGTACLDAETGKILWKNNDFQVKHDGGPGSSPVLFENLLILTYDGADAQYLVALNTQDGKEVWKRTRSAPFRENPITHRAFATPLLTQHAGKWQLISPGADQCHAYDPATGEELWHVRYVGFSTVPRPVADEQTVYLCTGYFKPDLMAVSLNGQGDVTESHLRWKVGGPIPDTPSPLLYEGNVYTVTNQGIAACHNAETGKREWVKRLGGNYSASPLAAGGRIYFSSEEGVTHVLDPAADPPTSVANKLNGAIKGSLAVIDHDLLVRTDSALYRISGSD